MRPTTFFASLLLGISGLTAAALAPAANCQSLSGKHFGGAWVVETNEVSPPMIVSSLGSSGVTVTTPFCRVRALVRPTADSTIYFEVWMPPAASWNGRYQGNAPGGYAGSMFYAPMEHAVRAGYATSSTDNGHTGNDSSWALGHAEKIADWGWRAVHETAVASKAIIAAYYGAPAKYSYFIGCSKGGGSAITEAQRFPTDYNGIIAGAMGWDQSRQFTKYLWTQQAAAAPGGWISPAKLAALHRAVLAACGKTDDMVDDPASCRYDPGLLQCKRGEAEDCLTAQQVETARKIYSGPISADGKSIYPGYARGSELGWSTAIMGKQDQPTMDSHGTTSLSNFLRDLLGHPEWDFRSLKLEDVMRLSQEKLGPSWDAVNPDLGPFKAAGGKLIGYHGWNDVNVPPEGGILYYDKVTAKMGGLEATQAFYRHFMAPGMEHCFDGPGPNSVGGPYDLPPPVHDAEHDIVMALEQWVEQGRAPTQLTATHYIDNTLAKGVESQRPWCAYPAVARYVGHGDRKQASSWACAAPAMK